MRRTLRPILIGFFTVMLLTAQGFSVRKTIPLRDVGAKGGSGEATVERMGSFMPDLRSLGVTVYGLAPGSVYSVWLLNEDGSIRPLGVESNHFRTDGSGKGRYVTTVYEYEFDRWRYIVINHHPGGDPSDTAGMVTVLKGDIRYGYHS